MSDHALRSLERLDTLLDGFSRQRILVVGDLMLDEYVWGQVNRISPEAPVMVVEVLDTTFALGGAGNVASNIQAMGASALVAGVVGSDPMGLALRDRVSECGCCPDGVVTAPDRPTTVKTRILAHSQQVVRVDREKRSALSQDTLERLSAYIRGALPGVDAVVLSDYAKGALARDLVEETISLAKRHGKPLAANLKPPRVDPFRNATFLTLNLHEAERAMNETIDSEETLFTAGAALRDRLQCDALLITRGSDGVVLFTEADPPLCLPARRVEVYDVAGAGDAVISAAALALAAGGTYAEAAAIGNIAGNAKVTKLGVAPVSREEMRRVAEMA